MTRQPRAFVRRHGLLCFFVLAYGVTWLAWAPYVLSRDGLDVLHFRFPAVLGDTQLAGILPGGYLGPLGSAFLVTALADGRAGLRRWAGRLFRWRVGWRWYAFALLGCPVLLMVGTFAMPGALADFRIPPAGVLLAYPPLLLLQMATTGLAEEPGWRDFALPRLQRSRGPLAGTLILGPLWAGWHLPLFLTDWAPRSLSPATIGIYLANAVAFSVIITWVFNRTGESLPVAMLVHSANNNVQATVWLAAFPALDTFRDMLAASLIGYGALAVVLVVATRGRLGHPSYAGGPSNVGDLSGAHDRGRAALRDPGEVPVGAGRVPERRPGGDDGGKSNGG